MLGKKQLDRRFLIAGNFQSMSQKLVSVVPRFAIVIHVALYATIRLSHRTFTAGTDQVEISSLRK